jgi:predicted SAM-dependent methyltransferase
VNIDGSRRAWTANRLWFLDQFLVRLHVLPPTDFGRHVMVHDLFEPLPFADNSVACIYAGEVWEHFELPDARQLTANCLRVLAPGGVLRVCVPDGPQFWERYLQLVHAQLDKPHAERSAQAIEKHVQLYFNEICTRRMLWGSMGHTHKWQFDEVQLVELFERTGFEQVARMPLHQSRIPDVEQVERSNVCIVEGVKPGRRDDA